MTLESELADLGVDVSTDRELLLKVSSDWSRMSPVLQDKLPPGRYVADLVVRPTSAQQVADVLAVAYRHDVPVTPRGAGTGNYGQATPFDGGIVLDLRGLDTVEVTGETVRAGAGAKLTTVDEVARAAGRDVWIFPSTKGSTVGGFVGGGSAGTGTIEHRTTSDGFVVSAVVAPMDGSGSLFTVSGAELEPFVHTYGVTGVLVEVEIRTDPAREWAAVYGSFGSYADLVAVHRTLTTLSVVPRLASGDEPALVPTLPVDLDPARWSLRVIAEASTVDEVTARIRTHGEMVRVARDYAETDVLSGMSYNHPVYFLQQAAPQPRLFHIESSGTPLWDDPDAVRACYPGPVHLHLELFQHGPGAMIVAKYTGEADLLAGMDRLEAIGVGVHSPHQWYVDRNVELARETARRTDPKGLLNPGKLVDAPPVDSRVNIGVVR
ncbi:FAD-binding oxidoreductase [Pseudonocardia sp. WMMC193]|uniref:FAD-binding oxidoreductase n=1 Tax=Pseudonocardia sp. WMMC193 TaxID=2911965 RepID=UPI001F43FD52|nr:FAD-binding oxidoreductase [Pseudonocardia sp. WMMC193]MCF7548836.1 FAD-binding oxidoreductase [Pseudonocardia sp. WMMC193]